MQGTVGTVEAFDTGRWTLISSVGSATFVVFGWKEWFRKVSKPKNRIFWRGVSQIWRGLNISPF